MQFKRGEKAIIQGKLYTVISDTDRMNRAKFKNEFSGEVFELYCGRLAHPVQPENTIPADGTIVWLVSQGEGHLAYFDKNPDIEWASIFRSGYSQQVFFNIEGWALPHPSELPEIATKERPPYAN